MSDQTCDVDGHTEDTYGGEHYWHCETPGTVEVDGVLMCEDHAGERGYGPKQEEYGFDPHDGLNPTRDPQLDRPCPTCSAPAGEDCRSFGYCPARSAARSPDDGLIRGTTTSVSGPKGYIDHVF